MKKIFTLLASMFLLVGCVESVAVLGTGAANGKVVQSALQSGASLGIKSQTGKTPMQHALAYAKKNKLQKEQKTIKNKSPNDKPLKKLTSSLQSSIDEKFKIKYLD
jgi:hypothetical protein